MGGSDGRKNSRALLRQNPLGRLSQKRVAGATANNISARWNTAMFVIAVHIGRIIQPGAGISGYDCCVRRRDAAWGERRGPPAVNTEICSLSVYPSVFHHLRGERRAKKPVKAQRWNYFPEILVYGSEDVSCRDRTKLLTVTNKSDLVNIRLFSRFVSFLF